MNQNQTNNNSSTKQTMYLFAYAFSIFATVITAILIIPLIWSVPMTIMIKKAKDDIGTTNERSHIVLAICSLIFLALITGILLLVAESITMNNNNIQNTNFENNDNLENESKQD